MSNESLIQVPPNVAEPVVLQRFLLRLVENLDILLGKRAQGTNEQYVAQQELLALSASLSTQLTDASEVLAAAIETANQTLGLSEEDIQELQEVNAEQDTRLSRIESSALYRTTMFSFEGRSTGGPVTFYYKNNIATGTRSSAGVYDFTLVNVDLEGEDYLDSTIFTTAYEIAPAVASDVFQVDVEITDATAGEFTVHIYVLTVGGGTDLVRTPYDPTGIDHIDIVGSYIKPGLL